MTTALSVSLSSSSHLHGTRLGTRRAVFVDLWSLMAESGLRVGQSGVCTLQAQTVAGLRLLQSAGYQLVVLSQQPGIAFGLLNEAELARIVKALQMALNEASLRMAGFYYCPHHPDGTIDGYRLTCNCRYQEPGLLLQAANELGLSLAESWRISSDVAAIDVAALLKCETIWLQSPLQEKAVQQTPNWAFNAQDVLHAAHLVLHMRPTRHVMHVPQTAYSKRALAS